MENSRLKTIIFFFLYVLAVSCSQDRIVKEYYQDHGLSYPVDVSEIGLLGVTYAGIEDDELLVNGAREFVQEGIMFIKAYFKHGNVRTIIPGTSAIVVTKPVFYRSESGEVGIMVKVVAYGAGEPDKELHLEIERLSPDKQFWRVENFAYFNRNSLYKWQYGGWVFN